MLPKEPLLLGGTSQLIPPALFVQLLIAFTGTGWISSTFLSLLFHVETVLTVCTVTVYRNQAEGSSHHFTLKNGRFAKLVQLQLIPLLLPLVMTFRCSVER